MTTPETESVTPTPTSPYPRRTWSRTSLKGALAAALILGAALGVSGTQLTQRYRSQPVLLLQPIQIGALKEGSVAAVQGQVQDVFGNSFVISDSTGRTLVDTGPRGEGQQVAAAQEMVTVQGRFDHGRLHAQVVARADGRTEGFGPGAPPRPDLAPPPSQPHPPGPPRSAP